MSKKNTYILKTLILLCTTVASSFYVLSTPPGNRRPGEASNRARQVPAPVQPAPVPVQPAPIPTPVLQPVEPQTQPIKKTPIVSPAEQEEQIEAMQEKPENTQTIAVSQPRKIQAPQPGWLTMAYATVVPIILVTLDNAVGSGIAASTKSAIKLFGARHEFMNLKNEAQEQATKMVESGDFEKNIREQANKTINKYNISKDDPEYAEIQKNLNKQIASPKQEKINLLTKNILALNKIDPDEMEKVTSFSSILSKTVTAGILNTIIPMVGKFIGYGVTLSLQGLMPAQQQ